MVLTTRDRDVIADVASFQVLTGQQLARLGHFRSKTRANATLARLVRFGYLARRYQPSVAGTTRALYYPGPHAFAVFDRPKSDLVHLRRQIVALSDLFLAHQLDITDVRLAFQKPAADYALLRWMTDADLRSLGLGLIPDGHVEYTLGAKRFSAFVEVDRGTETLSRWSRKVQTYTLLARSDRYRHVFGRPFFRVLVSTTNDTHLNHLRQATAKHTDRIFWFTTRDRLLVEGPLKSIWWRPVDATLHSLTEA